MLEKPLARGLIGVLWLIFYGKCFFLSGDREVFKAARNKLFASNEKQIDNHIP